MKDIFWKLMFSILKNYMDFIKIYHFLPERIEIERVEKLIANLHDQTECVIHIRNLKQTLNHELVLQNGRY